MAWCLYLYDVLHGLKLSNLFFGPLSIYLAFSFIHHVVDYRFHCLGWYITYVFYQFFLALFLWIKVETCTVIPLILPTAGIPWWEYWPWVPWVRCSLLVCLFCNQYFSLPVPEHISFGVAIWLEEGFLFYCTAHLFSDGTHDMVPSFLWIYGEREIKQY